MSVYREPCGCRHDGHKWLSMCEPHAAEFQERHQRALQEHDPQREAYLRKRCTCGAGFADACCATCWPV